MEALLKHAGALSADWLAALLGDAHALHGPRNTLLGAGHALLKQLRPGHVGALKGRQGVASPPQQFEQRIQPIRRLRCGGRCGGRSTHRLMELVVSGDFVLLLSQKHLWRWWCDHTIQIRLDEVEEHTILNSGVLLLLRSVVVVEIVEIDILDVGVRRGGA